MNNRDDLTAALAMLAEALRRRFGMTAMEVRIEVAERPGRPAFVLPFPPATAAPPPPSSAEPGSVKLNATTRRILRAVAGTDTESPTGQEIADAAGFPYEPELRKTLAALRKKGLLGGQARDQGYPITPLGLEALEPEE